VADSFLVALALRVFLSTATAVDGSVLVASTSTDSSATTAAVST
jgi:hypothetical protein